MRLTLRPGALRVRLIMPRFAGLLLLPGVLAAAPVSAQTAPTPISVGETVHGSLSTSDALMVDNSYYDFYVVQTSPGQRLVFTLRSDDFDAYLSAGRGGSAASYEYTDSDDDGAGGTDARLVIDAEGGPYLIRANSLHAASTGSYTLSVTGSAGSNAPGVRSLRAGETVSGRLTASDYLLDDGSYYDLYRYEGMAGDRISVTLRSSDFDTFLAVGTDEGGTELGNASFNDDGADGTNSAVAMTLPSSGSYLIRANSLMGGATGSYTIQLEATRGSEPSAGGFIFLGQVLDGVLTSSDPTLADGSY
ncbi:MAG TPA: hypothetical protein VK966_05775, partial [Longimicrobiales bacterium]|nr:hypothetical protein [Longimicrobiales bacterium]